MGLAALERRPICHSTLYQEPPRAPKGRCPWPNRAVWALMGLERRRTVQRSNRDAKVLLTGARKTRNQTQKCLA